MSERIVLASASPIRASLLTGAGVSIEISPARIDEEALKSAMMAEGAVPRDLADALAEGKARKISGKFSSAFVIGCDQVLEHDGAVLSKPADIGQARAQLMAMRGNRHRLFSAAVIYHEGAPQWRHIGEVRLTMRAFSDAYLDSYLARNWPQVGESVGAYRLEEEGVRLFSRIEGQYFHVLGIPLLEILNYLSLRGVIEA